MFYTYWCVASLSEVYTYVSQNCKHAIIYVYVSFISVVITQKRYSELLFCSRFTISVPSSMTGWTLMMKALWYFEAKATSYQATRCQIPDESNLQQHICENLAQICVNRQLCPWVWSTVDCVVQLHIQSRSGLFFLEGLLLCATKHISIYTFTHFMNLFLIVSLSLSYVDLHYSTCLIQSE